MLGRRRYPARCGIRITGNFLVSPSRAVKFPRRYPPINQTSWLAWISYENSYEFWSRWSFSPLSPDRHVGLQARVCRICNSAAIACPTEACAFSPLSYGKFRNCNSAVCTTWISGTSTGMTIARLRRDGSGSGRTRMGFN